MFDFKGYAAAVKKHWLLFAVTLFLVVIFAAGPFLWLWRKAKTLPVVGDALKKVPGAAS